MTKSTGKHRRGPDQQQAAKGGAGEAKQVEALKALRARQDRKQIDKGKK